MALYEIPVNDRRPHWRVGLTANRLPVDLTDAVSAHFTMRKGATVKVNNGLMTFIDRATGVVEYPWAAGDTDTAGYYAASVRIDWGAGEFQTFPSQGYFPITIGPVLTNLIDLGTYKRLLGISEADVTKDDAVSALLPAASLSVTTYTGRNFELAAGLPTTRTYHYDSEMLDIDDAVSVSAVQIDTPTPYVLSTDEFLPMPGDGGPVFYYLMFNSGPWRGGSPEMGFQRNLDKYELYNYITPTVTVTADWGWPEVPADVQLATALTIQGVTEGATNEGLTAEAIEGWSRSWGGRGGAATPSLTIPNRARDLLANYQRIYV